MSNTIFMQDLLAPYVSQLPIDQFVLEVNKLYHRFEADIYDVRHPKYTSDYPHSLRQTPEHYNVRV